MMGQYSNVWYDRQQISPSSPDDTSVDIMAANLSELIKSEIEHGIPVNRIVIGLCIFQYIFMNSVLHCKVYALSQP